MGDDLAKRARSFRMKLGALAGCAYFAPECTSRYAALGLGDSPGIYNGAAYSSAYYESRTALLGDINPGVAVAVFPHFGPTAVRDAVVRRRELCSADVLAHARQEGAGAHIRALLSTDAIDVSRLASLLRRAAEAVDLAGRPFASAIATADRPGGDAALAWQAAEILREHRGDSHVLAWSSAGLTGAQIQVLTAAWFGMGEPYLRSWDWTVAELDAARSELTELGLVRDGTITDDGRRLREDIEATTDRQCFPVLRALGDHFDEAAALAARASALVVQGGGFPTIGPDYFDWFARAIKHVAPEELTPPPH